MLTTQIFKYMFAGGLICEIRKPDNSPVVYKICSPQNEKGENPIIGSLSPAVFNEMLECMELLPYDGVHIDNGTQYSWYRLQQPKPAVLGKTTRISLAPKREEPIDEIVDTIADEQSEVFDAEDDVPVEVSAEETEETATQEAPAETAPEEYVPLIKQNPVIFASRRLKTVKNLGKFERLLDVLTVLRDGGIICCQEFPNEEARAACPNAPATGNYYTLHTKPVKKQNYLVTSLSHNLIEDLFDRGILMQLPVTGTRANGTQYTWYRLATPAITKVCRHPAIQMEAGYKYSNISDV